MPVAENVDDLVGVLGAQIAHQRSEGRISRPHESPDDPLMTRIEVPNTAIFLCGLSWPRNSLTCPKTRVM